MEQEEVVANRNNLDDLRRYSSRHSAAGIRTSTPIPAAQPYYSLQEKELPPLYPQTIWTRIADKYRHGKLMLIGAGWTGILIVTLVVLGTLGVFRNQVYRDKLGLPSVGKTKYPGESTGTATPGHFDMSGKGDGTYYDPGVGLTACGGYFTAQDMMVALNHVDYGQYANPNESPVCGACIIVTGPLGSAKAYIQDECPGCGQGSLDLSPAVFAMVGNFNDGRIPVSWKPC
ncbi:hypothetical protein EC973_004443 [Apophysomyces ossiformis]|uniref:RlpA-like double-psi beta-barrel-protein domain-containing protein-containing protein n=1 Tax=Apophysomyces ossiformis TaxID=679940 RepID=A0A8H7BX38_9FUNG|nr:hypothetical protein EC973_004443 [Apophysomyces ossiformis]